MPCRALLTRASIPPVLFALPSNPLIPCQCPAALRLSTLVPRADRLRATLSVSFQPLTPQIPCAAHQSVETQIAPLSTHTVCGRERIQLPRCAGLRTYRPKFSSRPHRALTPPLREPCSVHSPVAGSPVPICAVTHFPCGCRARPYPNPFLRFVYGPATTWRTVFRTRPTRALSRPCHACPFLYFCLPLAAPAVRACPPRLRFPPSPCAAQSAAPSSVCLPSYLSPVISCATSPATDPSDPCALFSAQPRRGIARPYPCCHALPSLISCTALLQPSPSFCLRPRSYITYPVSLSADSRPSSPLRRVPGSAPSPSLSRPPRPCTPPISLFSTITVRGPERIISFVLPGCVPIARHFERELTEH